MVAAPASLQREVTVVPAIRNDVHSGYKLKSVRPGSTAAQLGFRSEDKITHINGYDLTDDMQAMQLYTGLSGTRLFKVRYERGGRALVKTIRVA
jgi:type II secretory pathway component PulC